MKKLNTIILAAGKSKRINSNVSKIFHEIAGLPIIDYIYSIAKKISSNNIVIVCNAKNCKQMSKKFPDATIVIQKKALGTADAIACTKKIFKKNSKILILYGDVPLIKLNSIRKLIKLYNLSNSPGCLLTFKTKEPFGYGRVEIEKSKVVKITEQSDLTKDSINNNLCNSGIMICEKNFLFDNLINIKNNNFKREKYITDIFKIAYNKNYPFYHTSCSENELIGANTREDLIKLDLSLQQTLKAELIKKGITILQPATVRVSYDTKIGKDCLLEPFVIIKNGVKIKNNVTIKSHSVLEKCVIDENSTIGPSARIRPFSIIGKNVKIGNYVEIKNSIINQHTSISHLSYIGDSKIGKNVNIGAGTITCNYDGKNKNKTIIKDNVFIGSNTSLVAPITIGYNSKIGAGSVITKNVPSNSLSLERTEQKILKKIK